MLHKSIKFAYAAIALFSTMMAFLVMQLYDEATVTGVTGVVRINDSDRVSSAAQVRQMLASFARDNHVDIVREVGDPQHPDRVQHVYVATGNPDAEPAGWLADGYPSFSRNVVRKVHPFEEIGDLDPGGYYLLIGSGGSPTDLLDRFSQLGYHGWQNSYSPVRRGLELYAQGTMLWCAVIMALLLITAIGSGVLLNTRAYGVHQLHGHSFFRVLGQDLMSIAGYLVKLAALLFPCVTLPLFLYNELNQAANFAVLALAVLAFFVAVALTVHALALGLVYRGSVLSSLKGQLSSNWTMLASYAIRVPALFLAFSGATAMVVAVGHVADQRAEMDTWSAAGDASYVVLNGSLGRETPVLEAKVGNWIRRSSEQNKAILSWREPARPMPGGAPGDGGYENLFVNAAYLDAQAVLDESGQRVQGPATGKNTVKVLVPQKRWNDRDEIVAAIKEWVDFGIGKRPVAVPDLVPVMTRDNQSVFTYSGGDILNPDPRSEDPVIIALPNGSPVVPDVNYMAYATQDSVVFPDREFVKRTVAQEKLNQYVLAVNPVVDKAANTYRDAMRELRLRAFSLVASVAVLVFTAIGVAVVYSRRYAQTLFVKYLSGWTFARTYLAILLLEAGLALGLVCWTVMDTLARSAPGSGPVPAAPQPTEGLGNWDVLIAGIVAIVTVSFVVAALALFNAKMVKDRSAAV